jgi:hypothetical protein
MGRPYSVAATHRSRGRGSARSLWPHLVGSQHRLRSRRTRTPWWTGVQEPGIGDAVNVPPWALGRSGNAAAPRDCFRPCSAACHHVRARASCRRLLDIRRPGGPKPGRVRPWPRRSRDPIATCSRAEICALRHRRCRTCRRSGRCSSDNAPWWDVAQRPDSRRAHVPLSASARSRGRARKLQTASGTFGAPRGWSQQCLGCIDEQEVHDVSRSRAPHSSSQAGHARLRSANCGVDARIRGKRLRLRRNAGRDPGVVPLSQRRSLELCGASALMSDEARRRPAAGHEPV